MIGETIGNFKIVSRVGRGGMGDVFLAEQTSIGTKVAVKVLKPDISSDTEHVQRFFNEARAVSRIQHAGIVKIFDCGFHGEAAYLIMEYLEGETLAARIAHAGKLPLAQIGDFGRQIASVLDATHSAGITHRDLKPDNVYLIPDRELASGERVKVLDFGIAKLSGTLAGVSPATIGTMGTPAYMAPEQWGDASKVDWRADVYSLGCVAFEMTCGQPPFIVTNIAEACARHLHDPPPHAATIAAGTPPALDALLDELLAKAPEARPQSMREVARRFEAIGAGTTVSQLVTAATLPPGTGAPLTQPTTTVVTPPARRSRAGLVAIGGVLIAGAAGAGVYVVMKGSSAPASHGPVPSAAQQPRDAALAIAPPDAPIVAAIPQDAAVVAVAHDAALAAPHDAAAVAAVPPHDAAVVVAVPPDAGAHPKPPPRPVPPKPHGEIDAAEVMAVLQRHMPGFRRCYRRELAQDPALVGSGRVGTKFTIGGDGHVTEVTTSGDSEPLRTCIANQLRGLAFPSPKGGSVDFDYPFTFGDAAREEPPGELQETLGKPAIDATMGKLRARVEKCAEHEEGVAMVQADVTPDGKVTKASISGALSGTPTATCIVNLVKGAKFPKAKTGTTINYPFLLH